MRGRSFVAFLCQRTVQTCCSPVPVALLLSGLVLSASSCGDLEKVFGSSKCCCFPTLSTSKNDGKLVEPKQCSNADDYCAGTGAYSSVQDRRAYEQHCGTSGALDRRDNAIAFTSHTGALLPAVSLSAHLASERHGPQSSNNWHHDADQCDSECASNGPFCLKVNLENNNSMPSKVEEARKLIVDPARDRIRTREFLQIFALKTDPCGRGDTILTASQISNEGTSCFLNSSISDGKGMFKFTVRLPETLKGTRTVRENNVIVTFVDPNTSPSLIIGRIDLDTEFGGRVERAIANSESGVISTERGCIAVRTRAAP
jgi:hypothetical protein